MLKLIIWTWHAYVMHGTQKKTTQGKPRQGHLITFFVHIDQPVGRGNLQGGIALLTTLKFQKQGLGLFGESPHPTQSGQKKRLLAGTLPSPTRQLITCGDGEMDHVANKKKQKNKFRQAATPPPTLGDVMPQPREKSWWSA